MPDPTPVFSAQEVSDFLDAIANPRRLTPPEWWAAYDAPDPVADATPAAPVIEVSPDLARWASAEWDGESPLMAIGPPPGFTDRTNQGGK